MVAESSTVNQPKSQPPKRSPHWGVGLLIIIFRLLLLGVGGVTAGLVGISVAQVVPGNVQDPPLLERVLRWGINLRRGIYTPLSISSPDDVEPSPSATLDEESLPPVDSPDPSSSLSSIEQQQIQREIDRLQAELTQLSDRTAELESQLGAQAEATSLNQRLQNLEQLVSTATPSPEVVSDPAVTVDSAIVAQNGDIRMTLPSEALFASDGETLGASSSAILDEIVSEIRSYPGAAVQVAGFIDSQGNVERNRAQAFRQADIVKQYLEQALSDEAYHWVVIGYGQRSSPLETESTANESPNRRIEISITP